MLTLSIFKRSADGVVVGKIDTVPLVAPYVLMFHIQGIFEERTVFTVLFSGAALFYFWISYHYFYFSSITNNIFYRVSVLLRLQFHNLPRSKFLCRICEYDNIPLFW